MHPIFEQLTAHMQPETFTCARCGQTTPVQHHGGTGYATMIVGPYKDKKVCYDCVGILDSEQLSALAIGSKVSFYWSAKTSEITNWPGTLRIKVSRWYTTPHNWAGKKTHIWFTYAGHQFYATQTGSMNNIAHVRRIKKA